MKRRRSRPNEVTYTTCYKPINGTDMTEVEMIAKYEQTKERAASVGLTIKHDRLNQFTIYASRALIDLLCIFN